MRFRPLFLDRLRKSTFERELDARLAERKRLRAARSEAAKTGWRTRRLNHV